MEKFLEVKNLRVSYHSYAGEVQSVRGVSFSIDAGQSVAIVGESGCGKSVTAKTIMGLIQTPERSRREARSCSRGGISFPRRRSSGRNTGERTAPSSSRMRWRP